MDAVQADQPVNTPLLALVASTGLGTASQQMLSIVAASLVS